MALGALALGAAVLGGCGRPDDASGAAPDGTAPAPGSTPSAVTPSPGAPAAASDGAASDAAASDDPVLADFSGVVLPDGAAAAGLDYVNLSGRATKPTILEANGAGVALIDLENDGDLDLVFSQGCADLDTLITGPGADLEIFANDGSGNFTRRPGPGLRGWWTGLCAGDVDGDGDMDLVVGGFGQAAVLLQDGSGALVPVDEPGLLPPGDRRLVPGEPRTAGLPPTWITSVALFDADRDGHLDVYLGQYLDLDPVDPPLGELGEGVLALPCSWKGLEVYCGPRGMTAQPDRLLLGRGDGTFVDASERLGDVEPGFTLGVVPFDADGDGDTDLYVAADSVPNLLFVNDGTGTFAEVGTGAGVAVSTEGMAEAGMGVATGDLDRDGRMDLAVTNFSDEATQLFLGAPVGFRAATYRTGLQRETRRLLSWGVHLVDLDADGRLELFTANGHVYPQADSPNTGTSYAQPDTLWRFGRGLRAEAIPPGGDTSILALARGTRGSAVGDLDGDGAPEIVVVTIDGPAAIGRNTHGRTAHRLELRLEGAGARTGGGQTGGEGADGAASAGAPRSPRDGRGARVVVVPKLPENEAFAVLCEVQTTSGYQSSSSPYLAIGLGAATSYTSIEVRWPSGRIERIEAGDGGRRLFLREGAGVVKSEELER
ncbi:FG-GAP repeat protein [Planctomycetes bacterium Pla163]|uniref:FG-GAP repeat protein n=1 Tax=Rohdeia mirabilis TaxID=2528008 RepID=A0A518CYJ0_9BACT|nr:FG-GAP repeat protein [Planctomycetes bacterium Pla163]